ncbi:helix-turn-helix transcriptional regulator [Methylocystis sp. MJC1]|uniref:helix-turn-helix transcriptional regulator n=1 Tax=Methylocystis sp. MJC1 TaxID=2654282 RepID=UPI0013EC1A9C|nr:helix-turn-helix transcriptional regulator [Methylocystis sp. MJC1]MBU6525944.1 helix-turn-helix transcriptional regulator [Methylocystis sp. MJC1]UZX12410.1 helix-turn-helix transcriptional regulator [Methylocystis sp. MJC1]
MKLADYLTKNDITHADFGRLIRISQAAVTRYAQGDRFPKKEILERIYAATEGAVTPNDFFLFKNDAPAMPAGTEEAAQ